MKNAKKGSNKNLSYIMRFGMTVLTVILIVLFFSIMIMDRSRELHVLSIMQDLCVAELREW